MAKQDQPTLKKDLGQAQVWAIAFGCIIGWGSFINPGKKFLPNSGVAGTTIAMILGALVMIILSYSFAYMVPKNPDAGASFAFTRQCFGKSSAFVAGWFLVAASLANVPMNSTAIGLIVDGLDGPLDLLKFGFHYSIAGFEVWMGEMIFAMIILVIFAVFNMIGVKKAGFVSTVLAILLAVSAISLTIAAIISSKATGANMAPLWGFNKNAAIAAGAYSDSFANTNIASAILVTFAITPWAYVGFDTIPQAAEEANFSNKKMMLIMVVAIFFGCFVYSANNMVAAAVLENWPERVIDGDWVVLIAAEELMGTWGKVLVGTGVSCAVLSGIMGFFFSASRFMLSMARDGYLPEWFGKIDDRFGVPKNAMIFCLLFAMSGPILGREALGWFVDMSAIGASIGYFFTSGATIVTMKKDHDGTPLLKVMAWAGVIFSVIFVILQIIPIPGLEGVHFCKESYILLVVWIVLGAIFYAQQKKHFK